MRLRLFNRVRRPGRLDSGGSQAAGRGAPGRHRGPGPGGRGLRQQIHEPSPASPVPPGDQLPAGSLWRRRGPSAGLRLPRQSSGPLVPPGGPLPRRSPLAGRFPRRDGPALFPRNGEAPAGQAPRGGVPAEFSSRETPAGLPRREVRGRPWGDEVPGEDQGAIRADGARARARPWFTSPVRERPAARDARVPGSTLRRDVRPARDARPAQRGRTGRNAKRPWYETGGSRSRIRPAAVPGARDARSRAHEALPGPRESLPGTREALPGAREGLPGTREAVPGAHGRPGDRWRAPGLLEAAATGLPEAGPRPASAPPAPDGRRHCGSLERILHRQWDVAAPPGRETVRAIGRLAELPERLKDMLAAGLDGIYVGAGGVPDLDDMGHLRGLPLPSGHATWDVCAGAYGMRKILVGTRPSPTPDVMCHEVGHALDDIGAPDSQWQSDSAQFRGLYDRCLPHLVSDFHRQGEDLGRREFFADAFAAIASRQRPALVDMLGGDTRTALDVMLYFSRRCGI
jgi:hypothetical protein